LGGDTGKYQARHSGEGEKIRARRGSDLWERGKESEANREVLTNSTDESQAYDKISTAIVFGKVVVSLLERGKKSLWGGAEACGRGTRGARLGMKGQQVWRMDTGEVIGKTPHR